jgi:hypothetical protein
MFFFLSHILPAEAEVHGFAALAFVKFKVALKCGSQISGKSTYTKPHP